MNQPTHCPKCGAGRYGIQEGRYVFYCGAILILDDNRYDRPCGAQTAEPESEMEAARR